MSSSETTQVLTFTLGDDEYCVDIDYVAEIVDDQSLRTVPDTDAHVEGITDLRGETTTIVNPCELLDVETAGLITDGGRTDNRIIVLDSESVGTESATGWLVSGVHEVTEVTDDALDTASVSNTDLLRGLITDEDGFTLWLDPDAFTA